MNDIQIFNYGDFPVRTVLQGGEPWWVLADVCRVLDLERTDSTARKLDPDEKGTHSVSTPGGPQNMTIISESGLYSVILRSDKPEAKPFRRWVTHEVLPAIRKSGSYSVAPVQPQRPITTDDYLRAASIVANCRNERLPYVLGFLEQGGLSVPEIQNLNAGKPALTDGRKSRYAKTGEDVDAQEAACTIIETAVEQYGFTFAQIGRLTGIARNRIHDYSTKSKRPKPDRARYIVDVMTRYLPREGYKKRKED